MVWEEPLTPGHDVDPPNMAKQMEPVFMKVPEKVILLSFFEGISSAALLANELTGGVALHLSWEVDPGCMAVLRKQLFAVAPPCPDFTQIRDEGQKITAYCSFAAKVEP